MSRGLKRCAGLCVAVLLAGCSTRTQTIDTSTQVFEPIGGYASCGCAVQRRIAEHNSIYDTLVTGERKVYAAPCELQDLSPVISDDAGKLAELADARTPRDDGGT